MWALVAVVTTLVLVIAGVLVLSMNRKQHGSAEKKVFLVGCSGSGKTKLFYNLMTNESLSTVTSQVPNQFVMKSGDKSITVVDLPGHSRCRTEVMPGVEQAAGIVFVIDSETAMSQMASIVDFLYNLLSTRAIIQKRVPFLVVASKTDLFGHKDIDLIQSELENEFDFMRENRKKSNYVQGDEAVQLFLGDEDQEFKFSQLLNKVSFSSCSVNSNDTQSVRDFIKSLL